MPFHLGGWLESVDAAAAFNDLTALADQRLFTQGDNIRVPDLNNIVALAAGADAVVAPRARLYSPTLEGFNRFNITPFNSQDAAAVEPDSPQKVVDLRRTPLVVGVDELLRAELNNNPVAAQIQWVLAWFSDGAITPVASPNIFTVRATGTTTLTGSAWTAVTLTLDQNLPPGDYTIVGMRPSSAGCIAARVLFLTGESGLWRPGALGVDTQLDIQHEMFRYGGMGVWGTFPFTQLPQVEFLSVSADTAEIVDFDLIRG